jgi:hypothetical protein
MSCCGKLRGQISGATVAEQQPQRAPEVRGVGRQFVIQFEYTGASGMTMVGPVSGRRYRFERPGARVAIDPRDRPGLARVPRLRQVEA